jgi:hypothetical protein
MGLGVGGDLRGVLLGGLFLVVILVLEVCDLLLYTYLAAMAPVRARPTTLPMSTGVPVLSAP